MDDLRRAIIKALNAKAAERGAHVSAGGCKSFDDYKHETGRIAGLGDAAEVVTEVFRAYLKEEFDEDDD